MKFKDANQNGLPMQTLYNRWYKYPCHCQRASRAQFHDEHQDVHGPQRNRCQPPISPPRQNPYFLEYPKLSRSTRYETHDYVPPMHKGKILKIRA